LRDFAVIFAIFTKVCRVFCHFLPWFSTVPIDGFLGCWYVYGQMPFLSPNQCWREWLFTLMLSVSKKYSECIYTSVYLFLCMCVCRACGGAIGVMVAGVTNAVIHSFVSRTVWVRPAKMQNRSTVHFMVLL